MLRSIGVPELLIILAIAVLLFGSKKVPELAKGLGDAIREFKKAGREAKEAAEEVKKP